MRTGIIVILTIVSMWACKLKENPAPKLSGGNHMKVMAEILSLNQDSTAQVYINNVLQRNSSPLTHSLQNGDIVDFYFRTQNAHTVRQDYPVNTNHQGRFK